MKAHKTIEIGIVYHLIHETFKSKYSNNETFKLFERVYNEYFKFVDNKVELIPSQDLSSRIVQSPDDLDATFRKKRDKKSKGEYQYYRNSIKHIPEERRKLRPNVEASVQEFKHQLNNGKLKVRKLFRVVCFALNKAIGINFGRIYRLLVQNAFAFYYFLHFLINLMKNSFNFS